MSWKNFPRRIIHLDFHTGPDIPDVGKDFDAEEFARTFKEAHIIEDAFPLVDIPISVKLKNKPSRVYLVPEEKDLGFEYSDGYAHARITMAGGHGMLVLDK